MQRTIVAVEDAIVQIERVVIDGTGQALSALRDEARRVRDDLRTADGRYSGTTRALREFSAVLSREYPRLTSAAQEASSYAHRVGDLRWRRDADRAAYALLMASGLLDAAQEAQLADRIAAQAKAVSDCEAQEASSVAAYRAARSELDAAGWRAAAQIEAVTASSDETLLDRIAAVADTLGGCLETAQQWATDVWGHIVDAAERSVDTISALVGAAAVLHLVVAASGALIGALPLPLSGALIGLVAPAVAVAAAAIIVVSVLSEATAAVPKINRGTPRLPHAGPRGVADAGVTPFDECGEVDQLGALPWTEQGPRDDSTGTSIKIVKVVGTDGVVRWRVVLPSTQEWTPALLRGAGGALNDMDANLALMLAPAVETRYERAVMQALAEAGVGRDDPILLEGFSQGGIMAAHLAAYHGAEYEFAAVVAAGAPIDSMPIPASTTVVSVQHRQDVVPALDFVAASAGSVGGFVAAVGGVVLQADPGVANRHATTRNWLTIVDDDPTPDAHDGISAAASAHRASDYSATWRRHSDEIAGRFPSLDAYFAGGDFTYEAAEVSYFSWSDGSSP